jgi:uncharacterized protein YqjF (DUF2071 family)
VKLIPKLSVTMKLCDILYLSYLVPASRIRPFVPEILPMAYIDDRVFISIVIFHSSGVRLVNLPFLRFDYNQINLRTYIKDPQTKNHGVYFFCSGITSATIFFLSRFLNLPWENYNFLLSQNVIRRTIMPGISLQETGRASSISR